MRLGPQSSQPVILLPGGRTDDRLTCGRPRRRALEDWCRLLASTCLLVSVLTLRSRASACALPQAFSALGPRNSEYMKAPLHMETSSGEARKMLPVKVVQGAIWSFYDIVCAVVRGVKSASLFLKSLFFA